MKRMDGKPKTRWFQFRLSTVLILTALAAWTMVLHSQVSFYHDSVPVRMGTNSSVLLGFAINWKPTGRSIYWQVTIGQDLMGPAVALFAFLAWKAAGRLARGSFYTRAAE